MANQKNHTISLYLILVVLPTVFSGEENSVEDIRNTEQRKLFGGYRITPRTCKATKKTTVSLGGPKICMFNHECLQRQGQVVGACMDGFLFGACCELPSNVSTGDFLQDETLYVGNIENDISTKTTSTATKKPTTTSDMFDINSGVSQISASLLNPSILPTAEENGIFQIKDNQPFSSTGVTHQNTPDTLVVDEEVDNEIDPTYFKPTAIPNWSLKSSTSSNMDKITPVVSISISNAPLEYTTASGFHRPIFRPKPSQPTDTDKYVLVPTISHDVSKQNDSVINIGEWLSSTSSKPPSTSNIFSSLSTKQPSTSTEAGFTSSKPPSTSYVFSSTTPPRRTEATTKKSSVLPIKTKPTTKTTSSYYYSLAPAKTTLAYSPEAFSTSLKPPSTSYVYSSSSTKRPPSTFDSHIVGPGFTVSSSPLPSPAPTLIVLGPLPQETEPPRLRPTTYEQISSIAQRPATSTPSYTPVPIKPINHVTINNHITQNIYSTSERPSPTVLITPKPNIQTSSSTPLDDDTIEIVSSASSDDLNNFPPDRNPNLNLSSFNTINENDITTPVFIEDEQLDKQVESFVNKIVQGLQEPFQGLRDVVYNKNNATILKVGTTTIKPKQGTTTKKPLVKPSSSKPATVRPATRPPSKPTATSSANLRPVATTKPTATRKPTTKKPVSSNVTKKQTTTTKKPKATKKPSTTTTTTESYIEQAPSNDNLDPIDPEDYKTQCGIRPLFRASRIVGGKGAIFGEFPWQVLVRESTWLGLFTKNKCGGVLISHKYVMTAAHCQPGFLASLVAVFGEFDISGDKESKRSISRNVKRVIVHRQYDPSTFENDLALLELEQPVHFDTHIVPICLPRDDDDFTGRLATVTGWGRLKYNGGVPQILQEVQVPIMENNVCQEMFRTAGHSKVILESFLCAGYANGQKDSCEGDSGGPLVLERPDGRYQLAGTVSHGIKCAAPYLPGVYMRTQYFKPWITSITGVTSP